MPRAAASAWWSRRRPACPGGGVPTRLGGRDPARPGGRDPARPGEAAANKSEPRLLTRIITAPRRPDAGLEMGNHGPASRDVCYSRELERLGSALANIGSGIIKVYAGFKLKVLSQEEKESARAAAKVDEEMRKNSEQELAAVGKMDDDDFDEWRRKEEDEERKRQEGKKERKIALLLSVSQHLIDTSNVLNGLGEIAAGSKDAVSAIGLMVLGIPFLVKKGRGAAVGSAGGSSVHCSLGTGSRGLQLVLDRPVVTRAYDGRLCVIDAFGARRETVPGALGGCVLINTVEELSTAIEDYRDGRLRKFIDIDPTLVPLMTAFDLWKFLCTEDLTVLLRPGSQLPEIALRTRALLDEELAIKAHVLETQNVLDEQQSCLQMIQDRLHKSMHGQDVEKMKSLSKQKFD